MSEFELLFIVISIDNWPWVYKDDKKMKDRVGPVRLYNWNESWMKENFMYSVVLIVCIMRPVC